MRELVRSWLGQRRSIVPEKPEPKANSGGFIKRLSHAELLDSPRRKLLLQNIWHRTSVNSGQFERLYMEPIRRYAELVQQLPASENHHHAYLGGMLDHGLEIMAYALKMRQSYVLPIGSTPEEQAAQSEAWSAAVTFAALMHDIGKVAVDVRVELRSGRIWRAWEGPLTEDYRFQYVKGRDYKLHGAAAGLLYTRILPSQLMEWLSQYPDLWASLLYVLAGQFEHAGILGDIVVKSDQASVASELGGNPNRASTAPRNSLQKQLVEGLRYLVKNELRMNQPQASDGWITSDAVWLVSKTVSDRLRAHLLGQGTESIPDKNATLFNVLQDNGIIVANNAGKAIWNAEVTSDSGWKNSFTFLRVSPALIWSVGEQRPAEFAGQVVVAADAPESADDPVPAPGKSLVAADMPDNGQTAGSASTVVPSPPATDPGSDDIGDLLGLLGLAPTDPVPDIPPAPKAQAAATKPSKPTKLVPPDIGDADAGDEEPVSKPVEATLTSVAGPAGDTIGHSFMHWLKVGVGTRKIIINDARAKVHTVDGTALLVTPEIFRRYALEHPEKFKAGPGQDEPWLQAQKSFEKLKLHRKKPNGHNIWTCKVFGPRKTKSLKGYLMKELGDVFTTEMLDNPNLELLAPDSE